MKRRATSSSPADWQAQLRPVGAVLLSDAAAEADRIVAAANEEAARRVEAADLEAQQEVERAAARGAQSARSRAARDLAIARLDARHEVLQAKEDIRRQLIAAVHTAAARLRTDERYGALLDELERRAKSQLGADAVIDRDPEQSGGVIAVTGSRRVHYSLTALADRAVEALGDEISELWE